MTSGFNSSSALEAHEPVRIVLEHDEVVSLRELEHAAAALDGDRAASRILERREQVEQCRPRVAGELPRECLGVDALLIMVDACDVDPVPRRRPQRAVVRRRLDDETPFGCEMADHEIETLDRKSVV